MIVRSRRGASALETAAAIPVLVMVLAAACDFVHLALVEQQVGAAARAAARFGITGQPPERAPDPDATIEWCDGRAPPADNPRIARIREIVAMSRAGVLRIDRLCLELGTYAGYQSVGRPEPWADIDGDGRWSAGEPFSDVNGSGVWDADQARSAAGGGGEVTIYTLRYETPPLTGVTPGLPSDRILRFAARLPVRNEPF